MRTFAAAAVLLLCAACKPETPNPDSKSQAAPGTKPDAKPDAKPAEPAPEPAPGKAELQAAMTEHFAHATALEQAVIDGDLDAITTHAKWLVDELPKDTFPSAWQPTLANMQAAAGEAVSAAAAEDLGAAATATGKVVGACGSCHASTGGGPKFEGDPGQAPVGDDSKNRMLRHQWAADRMREGMIGPSEARWIAGAGAVSVAPPEPCPIENAEVLADDVLKLRERIYEIGAEAAKTPDPAARARVYGDYLSTCAGCHTGGC